jgi:hypothetical protein
MLDQRQIIPSFHFGKLLYTLFKKNFFIQHVGDRGFLYICISIIFYDSRPPGDDSCTKLLLKQAG